VLLHRQHELSSRRFCFYHGYVSIACQAEDTKARSSSVAAIRLGLARPAPTTGAKHGSQAKGSCWSELFLLLMCLPAQHSHKAAVLLSCTVHHSIDTMLMKLVCKRSLGVSSYERKSWVTLMPLYLFVKPCCIANNADCFAEPSSKPTCSAAKLTAAVQPVKLWHANSGSNKPASSCP
jgi:hypothetical protein